MSSVTFSGNTMVVNLGAVTNAQYLTVTVSNVKSNVQSYGGGGAVRFGLLRGDVNQDRVVTSAAAGIVSAQAGIALSNANYLLDVDVNGTITVTDVAMDNANLAAVLPMP